MRNNLNPLIILKESYNTDPYDYFEKSIYPKVKNTSIKIAKDMFTRYYLKLEKEHGLKLIKINSIDSLFGFDVELVDPERKNYRACIEGRILHDYIDKGLENKHKHDYMYYHVIVFFNLNGWCKLDRVYIGS